MLTLPQIKTRITWEIQALKDRKSRAEKVLSFRGADPDLAAEIEAIKERIGDLETLNSSRILHHRIRRALPTLNKIEAEVARFELRKIWRTALTLRAVLAI